MVYDKLEARMVQAEGVARTQASMIWERSFGFAGKFLEKHREPEQALMSPRSEALHSLSV